MERFRSGLQNLTRESVSYVPFVNSCFFYGFIIIWTYRSRRSMDAPEKSNAHNGIEVGLVKKSCSCYRFEKQKGERDLGLELFKRF